MNNTYQKPPASLHFTEPLRSFMETVRGFIFLILAKKENIGKGQLVMVVPGLLSSDISTVVLRKYLIKKGYQVLGWGLGINLGHLDVLPTFSKNIQTLAKEQDQKISLIGWSMGGLFVREMSHQLPDYIGKVITIGSPFANVYAPNNARWVYDLLNEETEANHLMAARLPQATSMPSVAIYSKSDGIVPWQACKESVDTELHRNIEVKSSHFGMGANPAVLTAILQSLQTS
jgi:hypothetical protein